MKKKINRNLYGIAVLAVVLTLGLTMLVFFEATKNQILDDLCTHVHILNSSENVLENLEENYSPKKDKLRITVINSEGTVIYESDGNAEEMSNHMERPEIQQALKNGEGKAVRKSDTFGAFTFYYAEKQSNGNVIRVSRNFGYLTGVFHYLIPAIIFIFAGILLLCIALGHYMTRRFMEPIKMLAKDPDRAGEIQTYPEIQPFIHTINEQHKDIKKNAKMRQEFTANVSHELKTPLTSISGYAELIEAGIAQGEDSIRFAGEIHKSAQRLLTLINDILRLSQMDSIEECVDLEPLDLYDMAENCQQMLQMHAQKNKIHMELVGEHRIVKANRQMLEELIYNLCDNAIRYNNPGGTVKVTVGGADKESFICVEDNGIGISKKDQARIFERFYRVDKSRSKQSGGTGLGLAIVKHIAALHQARIILDSDIGKGTKVKVIF